MIEVDSETQARYAYRQAIGVDVTTPSKPKPKKRPADVVSNAVHVMRVLTGEDEDSPEPDIAEKNAAAVALGRLGGAARAKSVSGEKRREIAKKAAASRWKTKKE